MPRLVVVLPLEPLADGAAFSLNEWPLHVTVAPTFVIDSDIAHVASLLDSVAPAMPVLTLLADHREGFGRGHDLPVTVIEPRAELTELHTELVNALESAGAVFDDPDFVREGFRPHVTKTRLAELEPGTSFVVMQLALVDMAPLGDARLRRTVWRRRLG